MKTDSALKPTTGLLLKPFLTIFLPTCVLFFLTSLYLFHSKKLAEIDRIELIRSYEIDLLSQKLSSMLDVLPKDLRFISTILERHVSLADHRSSDIPHTYDDHLTAVLMDTYEAREYYDQVRYIDRDGMEQIRIQRVNGQSFLVDNENRQNKSNRPYFAESIELSASSIYVSPIDLNQEFGRIELPARFMLRIACPFGGHSDEINRGVLVFNYRVSELTQSLSHPSALPGTEGLSMLINADGLLIGTSKGPDGAGLSEQTAVAESLASTNPAVWDRLRQGTEGEFTDETGLLWTYKRVAPWRGKGFYFSPKENEPTIDNDYFFLVSKTSMEDVHKEVLREMKGQFLLTLMFLLITGVGMWFLVAYREQTIQHQMELEWSNAELESRIAQRTDELQQSNIELQHQIEEKDQMEAMLLQAQKMEAMGSLAGGIAHDFNNLLTIIQGYSELAVLFMDDKEKVRESINTSLKAGEQARQLVQQILTFSRKQPEETAPLNVIPVVKEALKLVRSSLPTTIDIQQHVASGSLSIMGNQSHLHQLIMNLCTNAAHAMEEQGRGTLIVGVSSIDNSVAREKLNAEQGIEISVKDTGQGMNEEMRQRIFEPYFSTKDPEKGTGLGLAVVHGIVEGWNGVIEVDSIMGRGTEFRIYVPSLESDDSEEQDKHSQQLSQGDGHVLFVDDEENMTRLGETMLEHMGYTVTTHNDPQEALRDFTSNPSRFSVIITDYTMPGMTGNELLAAARDLRPDIPTVLGTGYSEEKVTDQVDQGLIDFFLEKPYSMDELTKAVQEAINKQTPR
jgi:signal transduction histidine kinase/CheY-like chemotaxis protein